MAFLLDYASYANVTFIKKIVCNEFNKLSLIHLHFPVALVPIYSDWHFYNHRRQLNFDYLPRVLVFVVQFNEFPIIELMLLLDMCISLEKFICQVTFTSKGTEWYDLVYYLPSIYPRGSTEFQRINRA